MAIAHLLQSNILLILPLCYTSICHQNISKKIQEEIVSYLSIRKCKLFQKWHFVIGNFRNSVHVRKCFEIRNNLNYLLSSDLAWIFYTDIVFPWEPPFSHILKHSFGPIVLMSVLLNCCCLHFMPARIEFWEYQHRLPRYLPSNDCR